MNVTDVNWVEDLDVNYGFNPALALEFRLNGEWKRSAVSFEKGAYDKAAAEEALKKWAEELGAVL